MFLSKLTHHFTSSNCVSCWYLKSWGHDLLWNPPKSTKDSLHRCCYVSVHGSPLSFRSDPSHFPKIHAARCSADHLGPFFPANAHHVLKNLEFLKEEGVHFPSPIYPCPQVCGESMTTQNTHHQRSFILMLMYIIIVYFLSEYNTSCNLREVRNMLQWTWHIQGL